LAERAVQTVKSGIRKQRAGSLHTKLSRFLFTYRSTPHSTTNMTPAELMIGRRMRTRLDCMLPSLQDRVQRSQQKMKELYDRKTEDRTVLPGMSVLVSQVSRLAGVDRATKWLPGRCISLSGTKITVKLEDGRVIQRHLDQVVPRSAPAEAEAAGEPVGAHAVTPGEGARRQYEVPCQVECPGVGEPPSPARAADRRLSGWLPRTRPDEGPSPSRARGRQLSGGQLPPVRRDPQSVTHPVSVEESSSAETTTAANGADLSLSERAVTLPLNSDLTEQQPVYVEPTNAPYQNLRPRK